MDMGGQAVPRGYYSNGSAVGSKEMLEASLEGFKPSGEDSNIARHGRLPPHQKNFAFIVIGYCLNLRVLKMGTEVYDNLRHSCRKVWELVGGSGKLKSDGGKGYFSLKVSFNYHKGGGGWCLMGWVAWGKDSTICLDGWYWARDRFLNG
ncbi:hypothetical protein RRG08_065179 [Elysia crispata]|uniref:Uncharacterized protein n=1 Tax=Elysia crispata TaxID=231223 RepID=A0AAE1D8M1_9GAST|nr:hypothetical protein RRG08_065179 [Elysia crispata]